MKFVVAGLVLVLVLAVGGFLVVAQAPLAPPVQNVEQPVADEHFPH